MRKLLTVALVLALPLLTYCQKKIAVIGSSTAAGFGASIPDSAYINLAKKYWQGLGLLDTLYNLADASTTTYNGMPDGFTPPPGRPAQNSNENITKAMSFNPDIVFIHYPSNDIGADFTLTEYLSNLRTMAGIVTAAGKTVYVMSTQPRNAFNATEKMNLKIGRDSIMAEFGAFALDFYTPLVDPATLNFNPLYTDPGAGGGVHPNDAGHQQIFQVAKNNIILSSPLALKLFDFQGSRDGSSIRLQWTTGQEDGPTHFEVQRSGNGTSFESIARENGKGKALGADYSWTDPSPLNGNNFYRLQILSGTQTTYSPVVNVAAHTGSATGWIGRIIPVSSHSLSVEMNVPATERTELRVYTAGGTLIGKQSFGALTPGTTVAVPVSGLSAGLYYVIVSTADGHKETKGFNKF
jgi:lysophospholipase L1-like esterase